MAMSFQPGASVSHWTSIDTLPCLACFLMKIPRLVGLLFNSRISLMKDGFYLKTFP